MSSLAVFFVALITASSAHAAKGELSLVGVSSGTILDATQMLAGKGEWKPDPAAQFVKLDLRFALAPTFNRIEIQSCGESFSDGANAYVNFDDASLFSEGGKPTLHFNFLKPILNARSVAFNFRYNQNVCVSRVRFMMNGKVAQITIPFLPEPMTGSVLALHDGRLDTDWSLDETDRAAEISFETEKRIDQIRVWNGDQRSTSRFKASARVKTLALFTDSQREVVSLKDSLEPQTLKLPNTIKGKVIRLLVEEAHGGALASAKMSEVQFGYDDEFMVTDVTPLAKEASTSLRQKFASVRLDRVLDRNLITRDDGTRWSIRLRSDGTFFMRGHTENLQRVRNFSYLGQYTFARIEKKSIHLSVRGFVTTLPFELDGSTCTRDCGGNPGPEPEFIEDEISIGAGKNGLIFVRDEGPRRSRGLEFDTLKTRLSKESE